jgi:hypothetical protein
LEVLILHAYAVGAAFSVRDADGSDDYAWRPTDIYWTDVEYRRPRPQPAPKSDWRARGRRASAVAVRRDASRIRTPDQIRAAGRRNCS